MRKFLPAPRILYKHAFRISPRLDRSRDLFSTCSLWPYWFLLGLLSSSPCQFRRNQFGRQRRWSNLAVNRENSVQEFSPSTRFPSHFRSDGAPVPSLSQVGGASLQPVLSPPPSSGPQVQGLLRGRHQTPLIELLPAVSKLAHGRASVMPGPCEGSG
ncbi:uncharacterized protein BO80DRAFT_76209 [Aspergillus ibericus CBS 121593]|uniref:Uncharacterized protein n=1 Tax=Aspergillus ibericus CBS 121593 TaxID=1448316 RepID=A0A395HF68_9EURO|nr:hypothetical protein BO80DRAFT_76209 [Aspergillus ibericus CBS 121593]RAL05638.1 hypothetical protein BO80DRAFT_76209 [Aspergillus ibericus CBS 121593]